MSQQGLTPQMPHLPSAEVSNWTALIIDDEPDNLTIAEKVLTFAGAQVFTAPNGAAGLKLLEQVIPTFILLDLAMRDMDGWQTLEHIRTNPTTQHIPTIALTAHAATTDRERAIERGFDGYIAKPFNLSTFMSEIARCLQTTADRKRGA